jgi:hypothetical protein
MYKSTTMSFSPENGLFPVKCPMTVTLALRSFWLRHLFLHNLLMMAAFKVCGWLQMICNCPIYQCFYTGLAWCHNALDSTTAEHWYTVIPGNLINVHTVLQGAWFNIPRFLYCRFDHSGCYYCTVTPDHLITITLHTVLYYGCANIQFEHSTFLKTCSKTGFPSERGFRKTVQQPLL